MAYRSLQSADPLIWRAPLRQRPAPDLVALLRETFSAHAPHFNDSVHLNQPAPHAALTLDEWSRPTVLSSLLATYGDHIYRNQPGQPRDARALKSLWAQWYLGLLAPPLMLALLTCPGELLITPQQIAAEFHESGRVASFWLGLQAAPLALVTSPRQRLEKLAIGVLQPVVTALENSGEINARLIWSNTGYLINWALGEWKNLLGEVQVNALRHSCFFEKQLLDGSDNPLYRTVIMRDGLLVRRTCCQRYRLPDVQQCGDCTLK